jgi:hypothetical protein
MDMARLIEGKGRGVKEGPAGGRRGGGFDHWQFAPFSAI